MSLSCCALVLLRHCFLLLFFFNDTATPEIYTLSLHDALPISENAHARPWPAVHCQSPGAPIRRVKRAGCDLVSRPAAPSKSAVDFAPLTSPSSLSRRGAEKDGLWSGHREAYE